MLGQPQEHSEAGRNMLVTPSEIEPATLPLVVQCLNQLRHQQRAPITEQYSSVNIEHFHLRCSWDNLRRIFLEHKLLKSYFERGN
jgi:hypothetical protein